MNRGLVIKMTLQVKDNRRSKKRQQKGKFNITVKREGAGGMYTIFDKVADDAAIEGEIKGIIKTERRYNADDEVIVERLMMECSISEEDARTYMEQYDQTGKVTLIDN